MVTASENIKSKSDAEEPKKTTTDESSDEDIPELEEGEVTEEQKKVAEAAGIAEQVFKNTFIQ